MSLPYLNSVGTLPHPQLVPFQDVAAQVILLHLVLLDTRLCTE